MHGISPAKTRRRSVKQEVQLQKPCTKETKGLHQSLHSPRRTMDGRWGLPKPPEIGKRVPVCLHVCVYMCVCASFQRKSSVGLIRLSEISKMHRSK